MLEGAQSVCKLPFSVQTGISRKRGSLLSDRAPHEAQDGVWVPGSSCASSAGGASRCRQLLTTAAGNGLKAADVHRTDFGSLCASGMFSGAGARRPKPPGVVLCPRSCEQVQETDNGCFLSSWLSRAGARVPDGETGTKANNRGVRCDRFQGRYIFVFPVHFSAGPSWKQCCPLSFAPRQGFGVQFLLKFLSCAGVTVIHKPDTEERCFWVFLQAIKITNAAISHSHLSICFVSCWHRCNSQ